MLAALDVRGAAKGGGGAQGAVHVSAVSGGGADTVCRRAPVRIWRRNQWDDWTWIGVRGCFGTDRAAGGQCGPCGAGASVDTMAGAVRVLGVQSIGAGAGIQPGDFEAEWAVSERGGLTRPIGVPAHSRPSQNSRCSCRSRHPQDGGHRSHTSDNNIQVQICRPNNVAVEL